MDREPNRTLARHEHQSLIAGVVLNRRRRYALYYLYDRSGPVAIDDVVAQVATWERAANPHEVSADHWESVADSLRRVHLPYLEAHGLVSYDPARDQVTDCVDDPDVELLLANDPRTAVAWYRVYLALTAVAALLLVGVRMEVPPFDRIGPVVAAGLVVGQFAVASLGYWYDVYRWRRRAEDAPPDFLVTLEENVGYRNEDDRSENEERPR